MKRQILLWAGLCLAFSGWAQTDTTGKSSNQPAHSDTIRVGSLVIIKNRQGIDDPAYIRIHPRRSERSHYKPSNVSTNWIIVDLGFANYTDKTNYSSLSAQQFAPGSTKDWFKLNTGKSVDVNIWLFMQRLNLVKHVVNLKYGFGIELNNYRYTENIKYLINPTEVIMDTLSYSKNKLATDYVTVPLMLDFNFTPGRRNGFGLSVGASAGYRYSSRQKLISDKYGKQKTFNDFDLNPWKISWIGELQLGPIKLYGSYATQSIFSKGLDQIPYNIGIRLSNW